MDPKTPDAVPATAMLRILLVEDNMDDAALFRASLSMTTEHPAVVDQANTLGSAFEALGRGRYDVVVQDLNLPDTQGLDGFQELRRLFPTMPVVVLTGTADRDLGLQAVRAGAQDFLVKGTFNSELLARALRYAIERKALLERIEYEATHDVLTGLFNRQKVMSDLENARLRAVRYGERLSICICDIDNFKRINDTYGHLAGDAVLRACGEAIQKELRTTDFVGRYGGDEFLVAFVHTNAGDSRNAVDRIRRRLDGVSIPAPNGTSFTFTVTFGLADVRGKEMPLTELMASADEALYHGKTSGKNCVVQSQLRGDNT